jgi:hypothetical protein
MGDDYPRLLTDRDIVLIRNGQHEAARLRAWLDGHDGPMPTYRIELVARAGNYTCPYTATAPDVFEALVRLRRQLPGRESGRRALLSVCRRRGHCTMPELELRPWAARWVCSDS